MRKNFRKKRVAVMIVSIIAVFSFSAHASYPNAKINNKTIFPATGVIHYASAFCKNDNFSVGPGQLQKDGSITAASWTANKRGACLITSITASLEGANKPVTTYTSSGTSYGNFIIQATENDFRVWSDHELAAENAKTREGKSPGFWIVNKTMWPISIGLEQVGCLYYGTIKPGEVFDRNTGAVWFTVTANISADGKEPRTDWDCVKPVAKVVGSIVVAAATAGGAVWLGLPAAAAEGTAAAALAPVVASNTAIVAGAAGSAAAAKAVDIATEEIGKALAPNSAGELKGQYAGPEWPFRCDQKPTYEITGGWGKVGKDKDGNIVIEPGTPLKVTKTNNCGNSMMLLSATSN